MFLWVIGKESPSKSVLHSSQSLQLGDPAVPRISLEKLLVKQKLEIVKILFFFIILVPLS